MIDATEARQAVREYLDSDDFQLEEFTDGWRVIVPLPPGTIGTASLVVERSSADLLSFPSSVPPRRLVEDFAAVRSRGRRIEQPER